MLRARHFLANDSHDGLGGATVLAEIEYSATFENPS